MDADALERHIVEAIELTLEEKVDAMRADLIEILAFIRELQTVVSEMADNPMLKAMGMGNLGGLKLPGM